MVWRLWSTVIANMCVASKMKEGGAHTQSGSLRKSNCNHAAEQLLMIVCCIQNTIKVEHDFSTSNFSKCREINSGLLVCGN